MSNEDRRIPPGPAEPFHGGRELFDWMGEQFQKFGNIYHASIYGADAYVITDPEYARHVLLRNWQNYTRGLHVKRIAFLMGKGLIVSEGEFWKKQRRMMQPAFHQRAINALMDVMIGANFSLLDKWERAAEVKRGVNITDDVSRMVLEVVLRSLFGGDYEEISPHFKIVADVSERDLAFAQAFQSLGKIILGIIARRRHAGETSMDILGMLMQAKDRDTNQGMSDRQVVNEVMTLIVAGHETTASTLNWTWYLVTQHPKTQERLAVEVDQNLAHDSPGLEDLARCPYSEQVLEETMRLYPALWLMTRRALKDDEIGRYFVPAGAEIYVSPYYIQRHPDLWENADQFDPERFAPGDREKRRRMMLLPFSVGPRSCIGEYFSRLEMQIHLIMVQKRLRLSFEQTKPLEVEAGINLRSKNDFIMMPELREPAIADRGRREGLVPDGRHVMLPPSFDPSARTVNKQYDARNNHVARSCLSGRRGNCAQYPREVARFDRSRGGCDRGSILECPRGRPVPRRAAGLVAVMAQIAARSRYRLRVLPHRASVRIGAAAAPFCSGRQRNCRSGTQARRRCRDACSCLEPGEAILRGYDAKWADQGNPIAWNGGGAERAHLSIPRSACRRGER